MAYLRGGRTRRPPPTTKSDVAMYISFTPAFVTPVYYRTLSVLPVRTRVGTGVVKDFYVPEVFHVALKFHVKFLRGVKICYDTGSDFAARARSWLSQARSGPV